MNCRICKAKPGDYVCEVTGFRLCGMECFKKGVAPFIQGQGDKRARGEDEKSPIIKINVGGTIFTTLRSTLMKYDGSILAVMADPEREMRFTTDENGLPFIDTDPDMFKLVLFWLRMGKRPAEYVKDLTKDNLRSVLEYLMLLEAWDEEILEEKVQNKIGEWFKRPYAGNTYFLISEEASFWTTQVGQRCLQFLKQNCDILKAKREPYGPKRLLWQDTEPGTYVLDAEAVNPSDVTSNMFINNDIYFAVPKQ